MIVVDASVVTKLINTQEKGSDIATKLLLAHIQGKEKILVPSLLFFEVANALATKSELREAYIQKGIHLLYEANFVVEEVEEENLKEASLLAKKYNTSVYDMIYAVIAKRKQATLVTSDSKFADKTKFPFIKILSSLN